MDKNSKDYKFAFEVANLINVLPLNKLMRWTKWESPDSNYYVEVKYDLYENGEIKSAHADVCYKEN
ncbi:MAG: hypothetical protein N4A63_14090 [Vallitalea sp.]|jgi:hypothetical protein|nr:hypothetical protein [Vallitalea sp.]